MGKDDPTTIIIFILTKDGTKSHLRTFDERLHVIVFFYNVILIVINGVII